MKKILAVPVFLSVVLSLILTACQPGPAEPAVVTQIVTEREEVVVTQEVEVVVTELVAVTAEAPEGPVRGGTLRYGAASDVFLVDPQKVTGEERDSSAFVEGLTSITPSGEIVPGLAESWEISDDGLTYTFHLRPDVQFHNGEPFTAEAVQWSFDRIQDPATEALRFAEMQVVESTEVVDDATLQVTLAAPYAPFLALLTDTFILSPDSPQQDGTVTQPIGTGPFEFIEWIPDQQMVLRRFENYWQPDVPYVDEIIRRVIVDEAARFAALQTGEVDLIFGFPSTQVADAALSEDYHIAYPSNSRWWALTFNSIDTPEPLQDPLVRQAIAMALDKTEINNLYELGLGTVNNQFYVPGEFWYVEEYQDESAQPRLDEARALLAEAGYPDGFEVTFIAPNAFGIDRLVTILQDQLSRIGIRGALEVSDWSSYEARLIAGENWGISAMGFAPKQDPVLNFSALRPESPVAGYIGGGIDDAELLALLDEAAQASDPEQRKELYHQVYLRMDELGAMIFLVNDYQIWAARNNVKNWHVGNGFMNQQDGGFTHLWLAP